MMTPRYKAGDLLQVNTVAGEKLLFIIRVNNKPQYESTYHMLTEEGKTIWIFCSSVDNQYPYRKIS